MAMRVFMAKEKAGVPSGTACPSNRRLFALSLQYFFPTVKTVRGNMVAQVRFTRSGLNSQRWADQEVMGAMHATLGRGFFVLLYGHVNTPKKSVRFAFKPSQNSERMNPFPCIGCARQTTFFMSRCDWQ
jgi:hypothetical protein